MFSGGIVSYILYSYKNKASVFCVILTVHESQSDQFSIQVDMSY